MRYTWWRVSRWVKREPWAVVVRAAEYVSEDEGKVEDVEEELIPVLDAGMLESAEIPSVRCTS